MLLFVLIVSICVQTGLWWKFYLFIFCLLIAIGKKKGRNLDGALISIRSFRLSSTVRANANEPVGKPSLPYRRGAGSTLQITFCFLSVLEFLEPSGIISGHVRDFREGSLPVARGF